MVRAPLEGIRVIELCHWVLGPTCARILGELGADVIKIEDPRGGDPVRGLLPPGLMKERGLTVNPFWEHWNGSKRAMTLDLNREQGKEVIQKLISIGDIFITNFRASVVDKFGLDYEKVKTINPKIVYAQATGFGMNGPHRDRAAFDDTTFWIRSGLMSVLGEPDSPPVPLRGAIGDLSSAVFLAGAIGLALLARERYGIGQKIDISLLASGMWAAGEDIQRRLIWGERVTNKKFSRKSAPNPLRNTYQAKDGKWFFFMMLQTDRFWESVCKAIGREDMIADRRFDTHEKRVLNSTEIISIFDGIFATRTREEWALRFEQYELVWEPETTISEVLSDPQINSNDYIAKVQHPSGTVFDLLRVPYQLSETRIEPRFSAPELSQHTEEILTELGYDWNQIAQLKENKVIL
ncbi:MAG: CoA transferase [Dehalococcoidia bacterium]|nr:CoA transferase [Dehalococcoidia bacterium]